MALKKIRIKAVEGNKVFKTLYQLWYGNRFIGTFTTRAEANRQGKRLLKEEKRLEEKYGK